jgi:hypothetical protein
MVGLALLALNMGGAISTWKYYHREQPHLVMGFGNGRGSVEHYSDGSVRHYVRTRIGKSKYEYKLVSVERAPPSPNVFQIWAPVIASGSITLLVVLLALWPAPGRAVEGLVRHLRAQYTNRTLLTAVGLVGLNLAGAVLTSNFYPRNPIRVGVESFGATAVVRDASGLTSIYQRVPAAGYRLIEVIREPLPPTLLRIWSPLIASTAITLLVLVVPPARLASRTTTTISNAGGDSPIRPNLRWRVARVAAIVAALFGLNLAGVVSRAPPVRSDIALDYPNLFGGVPSALVFRTDSQTVVRLPVDWSDLPGPPAYGERDRSGGYRISEETIDYKTNGSIVAYGGSPGQMPFRSHVIRPPMRSLLEIWSPVVTSASITLLVLASLYGYVRGETVRVSGGRL